MVDPRVVGPDDPLTRTLSLAPLVLLPTTDTYHWKIDVMTWVRLVKLCDTGGDISANGMFSALSLAFFGSLNCEKQSFLRNEMLKGERELDLGDQDEDTDNGTLEEKDEI